MSPVVVNQVPQDLPRGPGTELELARIEIPSSFARVQGLKAELAQKRTELPEDEVNAWADEQLEALYQESNEVVDELHRTGSVERPHSDKIVENRRFEFA